MGGAKAPEKKAAAPGKRKKKSAVREHTIDPIVPEASDTRPQSLLTDWDIHLFNEGTHHKLWEKLGPCRCTNIQFKRKYNSCNCSGTATNRYIKFSCGLLHVILSKPEIV